MVCILLPITWLVYLYFMSLHCSIEFLKIISLYLKCFLTIFLQLIYILKFIFSFFDIFLSVYLSNQIWCAPYINICLGRNELLDLTKHYNTHTCHPAYIISTLQQVVTPSLHTSRLKYARPLPTLIVPYGQWFMMPTVSPRFSIYPWPRILRVLTCWQNDWISIL